MKQPGNGGQGQTHCIKRDSKNFFICRTASLSGPGKLESAIPATKPSSFRNLSAPVYRAGMTLWAIGLCLRISPPKEAYNMITLDC